jgi:hypothetical protein
LLGFLAGFGQFIQQWINALQLWWGGWILANHPTLFSFNDFLVSNFALLFSLFGLGAAFQDISDRKEAEKSASRIFYLLDRKSKIDPLSSDGKILDTGSSSNRKRKSSIKKRMSSKRLEPKEESETEETFENNKTSEKSLKAPKKKSSKKLYTETDTEIPESPKKRKSAKKKSGKKKKDNEVDEGDDL